MYLVWVNGLNGLTPEKWPEVLKGSNNQERPHVIRHKLTDSESTLPIVVLAKLYPAPKQAAA